MLRTICAVVAGAFAASFTDWAFMGALWHEHYLEFPEVWRRQAGDKAGENKAVLWACLLNVLCAATVVSLCAHFMLSGVSTVKLAVALWVAGPLPLLLGNHLFIKLHPKITAAHCLGWLAKFLVCAAAAALLI